MEWVCGLETMCSLGRMQPFTNDKYPRSKQWPENIWKPFFMTVAPLEQMQLFCAEFQLAPIQLSGQERCNQGCSAIRKGHRKSGQNH